MTTSILTIRSLRPTERSLLATVVLAPLRAYCKRRDAKRSIAALRAMDDRMLKDIGITRCEIEHRVIYSGRRD